MRGLLIVFLLGVVGAFSISCNEDEDIISTDLKFWENALLQGAQCRLSDIDARTLAAEYAPGSVITDGDFIIDQNLSLYVYEVTFNDTVPVNLYLNEEPCALYQIDGSTPPYTYEIEPPLGLVKLQTALNNADSEVPEGTLIDWVLTREFPAKEWVYTFEYSTGASLTTIRIDATDGSVL
ncbi:MAG: PepSY domain-containing protein [Cyclobacteriaceae bacterium]